VELAVGDVDDLGDIPAQIEQCVEFDRTLGLAKAGPREEREADIDRRGVEGVHRRGEVHPERLGGIERLGERNEDLGEVGVDPPVARLVGIRQGAARHAAPDAHVVKLRLHRAETRLDVAEALPIRELGEGQAEELVETREAAHLVLALVARDAGAELRQREEVHRLRKDRSTGMHGSLLR
jgi:hypothetical protein